MGPKTSAMYDWNPGSLLGTDDLYMGVSKNRGEIPQNGWCVIMENPLFFNGMIWGENPTILSETSIYTTGWFLGTITQDGKRIHSLPKKTSAWAKVSAASDFWVGTEALTVDMSVQGGPSR